MIKGLRKCPSVKVAPPSVAVMGDAEITALLQRMEEHTPEAWLRRKEARSAQLERRSAELQARFAELEAQQKALVLEQARAREDVAAHKRRLEGQAESATRALAPLDQACALRIFRKVPVEARLLCREVCRSWRDFLDEHNEAWAELDFSDKARTTKNVELLLLAASRAKGAVTRLCVGPDYGLAPSVAAVISQQGQPAGDRAPLRSFWPRPSSSVDRPS